MERFRLSGLSFILGDGAGFNHRVEDKIAALDRALGMVKGIQAAGALNEPGEQGALRKVKLAYILAEVILRRFAEAIDGKTADLPERNFIRVHGEDLVLIEAMLEDDADDGLARLARVGALGREEESARKLLRKSGRSLLVAVKVEDVVAHRAQNAPIIDAAVLKESAVFNGDDGVHEILWNLVVGEQAALGSLRALTQPGDKQRLEFVTGKLLAVRVGDRIHHAAAHVDGCTV